MIRLGSSLVVGCWVDLEPNVRDRCERRGYDGDAGSLSGLIWKDRHRVSIFCRRPACSHLQAPGSKCCRPRQYRPFNRGAGTSVPVVSTRKWRLDDVLGQNIVIRWNCGVRPGYSQYGQRRCYSPERCGSSICVRQYVNLAAVHTEQYARVSEAGGNAAERIELRVVQHQAVRVVQHNELRTSGIRLHRENEARKISHRGDGAGRRIVNRSGPRFMIARHDYLSSIAAARQVAQVESRRQ